MKKIRKSIQIIVCVLVIFASLFALTACDFGSLTGNTSSDKTSSGSKKNKDTEVENKVELSEAIQKYDQQNVRSSDLTIDLVATFYSDYLNNYTSSKMGATIEAERIQNDGKHYFSASLTPSAATEEGISGMLRLISQGKSLSQFSSLFSYVVGFLNGDISLAMEMGEVDGIYNIMASYKNENNQSAEKKIWYVADEKTINNWMKESSFNLAENQAGNYLMKSVYSGLNKKSPLFSKDNASAYVDKTGAATYDIALKTTTQTVVSFIKSILSGTGLEKLDDYTDYIDLVAPWITIKTATVEANVTSDDLPKNITNNFVLDINIPVEGAKQLVGKLLQDELITAEAKTACFTLINQAKDVLAGTNEENKDCFGISLDIDIAENFYYTASECSLADKNTDLFLDINEEAEGRQNLNDVLAGVIDDVDTYLAGLVQNFDALYHNDLASILQDAQDALDEYRQNGKTIFTKNDIESIVLSVLERYTPSSETNDKNPTTESGNTLKDKITDIFRKYAGE